MKNIKTYTASLNEAAEQDQLNRRLLSAIDSKDPEEVRRLLDAGADANTRRSSAKDKPTALHIAAEAGDVDMVGLLLDRGAKIDARDKNRFTPLHTAASKNSADVCSLLLDRGAKKDAEDEYGYTPIEKAVSAGSKDVVMLFLKRGYSIDHSDSGGITLLHKAAQFNNKDMVRMFIELGARADTKDNYGGSAITSAISVRDLDMARMLLDAGADANHTDGNGRSILWWTVQPSPFTNRDIAKEFAKLLILRGANILDAFSSTEEILSFFDGDIDWMPEGKLKAKIKRMQRGKSAFGM